MNYNELEFNIIIEKLKEHALSDKAKDALSSLHPYMDEDICVRKMAETTCARRMLDGLGSPPLPLMFGLDDTIKLAEAGGMLSPESLGGVATFVASCKRMAAYLARGEQSYGGVASYGRGVEDMSGLRTEIETCVNGERLYDDASPALKGVRRKLEHLEGQIKEKLNAILKSRRQYLADTYITQRQGRYVLPVQRKYQGQFGGAVIEASAKGSTVFMEPSVVAKLQNELSALAIEEDAEVRRILYTLSGMVADGAPVLRRNMEVMEILDVLFAKAKLSAAMKAREVEIGGERRLVINKGRHPLLPADKCVPLDFCMDEGIRGVIITGPNTGGKTVAVKTVGLLSLMAQCGLHLPCGQDSYIAMQDGYWCDIGDSQDISQNLSTFSGHMTGVIRILEHASKDSLVLLDELGSGTDPAEGMGIAVAVLEELRQRGCMFLVTTHYPQVKAYARQADGVTGARMAFDTESLEPLYRLEMGKDGESCALHIAKRLGLPEHLLSRARAEVYGEAAGMGGMPAAMPAPRSKLKRSAVPKQTADPSGKFGMGDSVVLPGGELGIVYKPADKSGDVVVQVKGEKRSIKHNRLRLKLPASELYPPDYDFSIIFDTVANRKARHKLGKRHDPDLVITYDE